MGEDQADQAISVFFQARGELRAFLNIYFLAIAALLGWLFTHREMQWHYRLFLAIAFGLLAAINWVGIRYSFEIIEATQSDLTRIIDLASKYPENHKLLNPAIVKQIEALWFSRCLFLSAHALIDFLVLYLIFWDQLNNLYRYIWKKIKTPIGNNSPL